MKLHQLSLFLENRPGTLKPPCKCLADAGMNLLALTLADTNEFGILRLIVKDWQRAEQVLRGAGFLVKVTEVVAIDVANKPGGLLSVLDVLDSAAEPIEYMYAFSAGSRDRHAHAAMIFRFGNPDAAMRALAEHGINPVAPAELFERMNA